jgi:propionyl-CoA carboxylase alpha chain
MVAPRGHPMECFRTSHGRVVVTSRHSGNGAIAEPPAMTSREIRRVLVANRGEIARRVFRTCRHLGISTVAVYSEPDAGSLFVRDADVAIALGGASPSESYLRGDAVIDAARRAGADAIHPGYGFLSENAAFARSVIDAGLIWIGPSPDAIAAMGSKTEARDRMEQAGVPVLPGARLDGETGDALAALADQIGYPLLVKASAGGGGKGMRLVERPDEIANAVDGARREAASAFGDDAVFIERFAARARHVEIQIIGDEHGQVCSLHERDCSVQRRHQKVIEEAPSPAVGPELRSRMSAAAVAAGEALGYVGAGTVEFLLADDGSFFFLEVNTRLQVEHPVTEMVTGLDLVQLQLHVAEGRPLPQTARSPALNGHAVEARLYAEDAAHGFLPQTGTLERFAIPDSVRVDTAVSHGTTISPHYDPMIAKVIAHGATRAEAVRKLADALRRSDIHGLTTNRDFLVRVLTHPEFAGGGADTGFLDRHEPAALSATLIDEQERRTATAAAALAAQAARRKDALVMRTLPSGWRNNPSVPQSVTYSSDGEPVTVEYRIARDGSIRMLRVGGMELSSPRVHAIDPQHVDLEVDGLRRLYRVRADGNGAVFVNTSHGQLDLDELPRFPDAAHAAQPGSLESPLPGRVIRVLAEAGTIVEAGQPLLIIEAMKMEHEIIAPAGGPLAELRVAEGDQVETGTVLVVIGEGA